MALGSTQPLTEMTTGTLPVAAKGGRRVSLITLPPSMSRLSRKCVKPRCITILWAFAACYRDSFTCFLSFATCSSETATVFQRVTRHYIPEDRIFRNHCRKNSRSYLKECVTWSADVPLRVQGVTLEMEVLDCITSYISLLTQLINNIYRRWAVFSFYISTLMYARVAFP
jgi:hypothetical protein